MMVKPPRRAVWRIISGGDTEFNLVCLSDTFFVDSKSGGIAPFGSMPPVSRFECLSGITLFGSLPHRLLGLNAFQALFFSGRCLKDIVYHSRGQRRCRCPRVLGLRIVVSGRHAEFDLVCLSDTTIVVLESGGISPFGSMPPVSRFECLSGIFPHKGLWG